MQDSIATKPIRDLPAEPVVTSPLHTDEELIVAQPYKAVAEETVVKETRRQQTIVNVRAVKSRHEVPQYLAYPYAGAPLDARTFKPITIQKADSEASADRSVPVAANDSTAIADSIAPGPIEGEVKEGIVLINPLSKFTDGVKDNGRSSFWDGGMSWVYLALAVMFCVTALKFKGSTRYLRALVSDLTETRVRHNAFDDTVKETSLMILLNLSWVLCTGILLWTLLKFDFAGQAAADSINLRVGEPEGVWICTGMVGLYLGGMMLAYLIVGNVFSDSKLTRLWIKGASASTGLQAFLMFPLALLALTYVKWAGAVLIVGASVFVLGKIVFLYKGFRIFFTQISSWMLFLYYLCSLEVIPIILTYLATLWICTSWL